MLRVYACIVEQHDLRLVVLAVLICLFASYGALSLTVHASRAASRRGRCRWLGAAAIVGGSGIWATHFIAMLAFQPNLPVGYDIGLTLLSIAIAIGVTGSAISLAVARPRRVVLAGAIAGLAVAAMHFVGMAALRVPATIGWEAAYVAAALAAGVGGSAAAFALALVRPSRLRHLAGGAMLALGICGLHFIAMAAAELDPDYGITMPNRLLDPGTLAVAVAAVSLLIVGLGSVGQLVDLHLTKREAQETVRLRAHVAELESMQRQLEAAHADMQVALAAAEAGSKAKTQFLAAMSHELRTPLNAVIGFSEILAAETFGPLGHERYRGYVRDIRSSGAHLLKVINDILDTSKIEAERLHLADDRVDPAAVVAAVTQMTRPLAQQGGVVLADDIEPGLPLLRADDRRMRQVLLNLLSNAVKFTPKGGTVRVSAFRRGADLAIAVADSGIGIAPHDLKRAFERFSQIDARLSRRYEGIGLGLPLSQRLMELHGGTLDLVSEPGKGTTVTVTFPAERLIAAEGAPRRAA